MCQDAKIVSRALGSLSQVRSLNNVAFELPCPLMMSETPEEHCYKLCRIDRMAMNPLVRARSRQWHYFPPCC